jgi:hypothetical protein
MTDEAKTLSEISHTDPYTDRVFGETQIYERGRMIAADGGESEPIEDDDESQTLADIAHTSPDDETSAQRTFDRGESR